MKIDITDDLRDLLAKAEGLSAEARKEIDDECDGIDRIHNRVADERDSEAARADAAPSEDEINDDLRGDLARELEPIFAAIHTGDLDRARGGVRQLAGLLGGNDPIILAIQRARSRPQLHLHVAA